MMFVWFNVSFGFRFLVTKIQIFSQCWVAYRRPTTTLHMVLTCDLRGTIYGLRSKVYGFKF